MNKTIDLELAIKNASANISKNVCNLMEQHKVTVEELSQITGVTRQSIYHAINNTRTPSLKKILAFSLVFEVSIDDLMK